MEFVRYLNRATEVAHEDVVFIHDKNEETGVEVDVAFQYCGEYTENVHCYANNINTVDGGTHLTGFRTALTRTLNAYGKKENIFKDLVPTGDDLREGLTAVVSVRLPEPQFEAQTKGKLNNPEVEGMVNSVVGDFIAKYLEEHPKTARAIVSRALLAAEARESAARRGPWSASARACSPVAGCPASSATAPAARLTSASSTWSRAIRPAVRPRAAGFRMYQAILPLRGKIINAFKSRDDKVLNNEEVRSMISAVGIGFGAEVNLSKRRYGKIIIMTDADVDGSHIRTLLLTFFYRQMYELVKAGHVFVAQPPLFRVRRKKETYYVQTEEEMKTQLLEAGLQDAVFEPGDGRVIAGAEMEHLCRLLSSLEDSLVALERRGIGLRSHAMRQDPVSGRLPVYHVYLGHEEHWFTTRVELDAFLALQEQAAGAELDAGDLSSGNGHGTNGDSPDGEGSGLEDAASTRVRIVELHEVRSINNQLAELRRVQFDLSSLIPQEHTGVQEPRYHLRRGDQTRGLEDLRGLLAAVREAGEKGLQVTRFKGLGEMNAEELRQTTLDPENRTLLRVRMEDASAADDLFRILMGEKVEPRREYIEKHALEARNLDV